MGRMNTEEGTGLRAFLVDDEPLARERLRRLLLASETAIDIVGEASTGEKAIAAIHETRPDVVFLDVQMPILDGFDVVDLLVYPRPQIVFVTAYDQYAIRAFDVHAVDYLTKPVRAVRLEQTLGRLVPHAGKAGSDRAAERAIDAVLAERPQHSMSRVAVRIGNRLRIVRIDEIVRFEAESKVVMACTPAGSYPVDLSLDELERRLDRGRFIRTHRSYLVNASEIVEVIRWFAGSFMIRTRDGMQIPLARRRARDVRRMLEG